MGMLGLNGVVCYLTPLELVFIPDTLLVEGEKSDLINRLRQILCSGNIAKKLDLEPESIDLHESKIKILDASYDFRLSIDYQVFKIFQDLSVQSIKDNGIANSYDTSYKIASNILEILENGLFSTRFQPIYSLKTGALFGYECLSYLFFNTPFLNIVQLIEAAKETGMLFSLERNLREKAFFNAKKQNINKRISINVDPTVMQDSAREIEVTRSLAQKYGFPYDQTIIEITENINQIEVENALCAMEHYKNQGFLVAIDDVGAGISLVPLIMQNTPDLIKLDRSMIEDVDRSYAKLRIVKALVDVAHSLNIMVIAEGIEKNDELKELKKLGVDLGQGYYLGRPSDETAVFKDVSERIRLLSSLEIKNDYKNQRRIVEDLAVYVETVHVKTQVKEVIKKFKENEDLNALPIVSSADIPVGLVMRERLFLKTSSKFGYALYSERPIEQVMDSKPVIIEIDDSLEKVSKLCLDRPAYKVYDAFIVVSNGLYVGMGTVYSLFKKTSELQLQYATYANPLTGLPGNIPIYDEINRRIKAKLWQVVCYADLDNFKAYNDCYGFTHGDDVLKYTAFILKDNMDGIPDSFTGHVGGDDFIFIVPPEFAANVCQKILESFDTSIANFYNEKDRECCCMKSIDREGKARKFPIMAMSIGCVHVDPHKFSSHLEVSEIATQIKKDAKKNPKSCYILSLDKAS